MEHTGPILSVPFLPVTFSPWRCISAPFVKTVFCGSPLKPKFSMLQLFSRTSEATLPLSFRIEASHPELQHRDQSGGGAPAYQDVEDDDADPNYARIQSFRDRNMSSPPQPLPQSPPYSTTPHALARTPSPQSPSLFLGHGGHGNEPAAVPDEDPLDKLYAKVNKPRGAGPTSPPVSAAANDR